jgi:hypothetical protein
MKKAWELSVLCAADVSIMIFSSQGKAYEFSSKELDSEIDKYLDVRDAVQMNIESDLSTKGSSSVDGRRSLRRWLRQGKTTMMTRTRCLDVDRRRK